MKRTFSTWEAATALGKNPNRFAEWARDHDLAPLRRQRIGRSTVTVWAVRDVYEAVRRVRAGQTGQTMIAGAGIPTVEQSCSEVA